MEEKAPFSSVPVMSRPKRIVFGLLSSVVAFSILFLVAYLLENFKRQALQEQQTRAKYQLVGQKSRKAPRKKRVRVNGER